MHLAPDPPFQNTVMVVLDSMMEPLLDHQDTFLVHYCTLDADPQGRPPGDPLFDNSTKSCLHKISKSNNKVCLFCIVCPWDCTLKMVCYYSA